MQPLSHFHRRLAGGGLLIAAVLMSGCATTTPPPKAAPIAKPAIAPTKPNPEFVPVVRYGRYTLVELAPASAQQDLLLQVVDVSIPDTRSATVGDALHHVLLRSGYQLCPGATSPHSTHCRCQHPTIGWGRCCFAMPC